MRSVKLMLIVALVSAVSLAARQSADRGPSAETFTATAVSLGGPRSETEVTPVELEITRWSSTGERQRLLETVKQKGAEAAVDVLRELKPVGSIQLPGSVAYELRYSQEVSLPEGGRRIFLATDRPVSHREIATRPELSKYPFTFIELRLDGEGQGQGKMALAAQINVSKDGEFVELVNYAAEPVQLNNVKKQ